MTMATAEWDNIAQYNFFWNIYQIISDLKGPSLVSKRRWVNSNTSPSLLSHNGSTILHSTATPSSYPHDRIVVNRPKPFGTLPSVLMRLSWTIAAPPQTKRKNISVPLLLGFSLLLILHGTVLYNSWCIWAQTSEQSYEKITPSHLARQMGSTRWNCKLSDRSHEAEAWTKYVNVQAHETNVAATMCSIYIWTSFIPTHPTHAVASTMYGHVSNISVV